MFDGMMSRSEHVEWPRVDVGRSRCTDYPVASLGASTEHQNLYLSIAPPYFLLPTRTRISDASFFMTAVASPSLDFLR